MARALALCAALALPATRAQITDSIDWAAFLSRHDPIWRWNATCTAGYSISNDTLPVGGASCGAFNCSAAATCVEESARFCDACASCDGFALNPAWRRGLTPQTFARGFAPARNVGWTLYAKGGPALRNHSSCEAGAAAVAWEDAAFYGNGLLGGLVLVDAEDAQHTLRFQVGRTDVADHRGANSSHATNNLMLDKPRLPVGSLGLTLKGAISEAWMRVYLHNGTIEGSVTTTLGAVTFTIAALRTRLAIVLAWRASGGESVDPATGAGGARLDFVALPGNSTRNVPAGEYTPNPPPACAGSQWDAGTLVCEQPLLAGGSYATAVVTRATADGALVTALHIANDWPAASSPATAAAVAGAVARDGASDLAALLQEHADAWAAWWPASFVSLSDTVLESTWAMQMYKYASAAREGGPAMDLMGPWWQKSGWELYWADVCLLSLAFSLSLSLSL